MNSNFKRSLVYLVLFIALLAPGKVNAQNEDSITILFTHDLHDHFYPFTVERDGGFEELGGFSRIYSAILEEREIDPDLLLVDAGDFSMGTLFQTIFESHSPALRTMGKLGYDATTLGNHEFDFRPEGLANSLNSARSSGEELPVIVASNSYFPLDEEESLIPDLENLKTAMEDYGVRDYLVLERKDIKIGIFGLMGEDADTNAPMAGVEFENIVDVSREMVDLLKNKENVDLIIALSHTGTNENRSKSEDENLAKKVPEIDVIISGHAHTELNQPIVIENTVIGSAGRYGENIGKILISKNKDNRWKLDDYKLLKIDKSYEENEKISQYIDSFKRDIQKEYLDKFDMEFDQVLAHTPFSFTPSYMFGKEHKEDTLGNLISDSYIYSVKKAEGADYRDIDLAIVPAGVIRDSFTAGDITVSDVFNVSSLGIGADRISGYPLLDVYLTGREIKTVAEVDASIQPVMPVAQLYIAGLSYEFNPNRIFFDKITDVYLLDEDGDRREIVDDQLYRVVAGLYSAQMLSVVSDRSFNLLSATPKTEDGTPIEDYESRIIYSDGQELKEWLALAQYLESFPKENGIAQVPSYYNELQARKTVRDENGMVARFANPNKFSLAVYAIILALIGLISWFAFAIIKRMNRRDKNQ